MSTCFSGKLLTNDEKIQIATLKDEKDYSYRKIASIVKRSGTVVRHYLVDRDGYGKIKSERRPKKITEYQKQIIIEHVTDHNKSSRSVKEELSLPISAAMVRVIVKNYKRQTDKSVRYELEFLPVFASSRFEFALLCNYIFVDFIRITSPIQDEMQFAELRAHIRHSGRSQRAQKDGARRQGVIRM